MYIVSFLWTNQHGDCGEVVNTPACGAGIRGFDPHQSPHIGPWPSG